MKKTNAGFSMVAIIIGIVVVVAIAFLVPRSNPLNGAIKDVQPLGVICPKSASYTSSIQNVNGSSDEKIYADCIWSGNELTTQTGVSSIANAGWAFTASTTTGNKHGEIYSFEKTIGKRKYILRIEDVDGPSVLYRKDGYPLSVRISTH